ncbi:coproporphyrinogen III oxidase, partial [Pseudoalteromonas sp. S4492]
INELICHFKLDFAEVEQRFDLRFNDYFSESLEALKPMANDGLLTLTGKGIQIEPRGKMLIRNICMQFDGYFKQQKQQQQNLYSKVI